MDILLALKGQASKLQQQVGHGQCGHQSPGRKEQRCSSQETASLRKCTGHDVEGTKDAVGEEQSCEEECLGQPSPIHDDGIRVPVVSWWRNRRCASPAS